MKKPWSQKTVLERIDATISHYKKEIVERQESSVNGYLLKGMFNGFIVALEKIKEPRDDKATR